MDETKTQHKHLGSMTTSEIMAGIQDHQQQINLFVEHLTLRASLQGYTEQQQDALLTLVEEALTYIEEVPVTPEWEGRRNELIARLKRNV